MFVVLLLATNKLIATDDKTGLLFCAPFFITFIGVSVNVVMLTTQPHSPVINSIRPRTIVDLLLRYIIHRLSDFEDKLCEKSWLWFWTIHPFVFIHPVVCLTTVPQILPEWVLNILRSSASSFNLQYPLFSLRSSSRCLHILHRLPSLLSFLQ
jgi:hypothetical protein